MADPFVELRGEVLREHVDIIDAVAQATPGASRMSVLRDIVEDWVGRKLHEHRMIDGVLRGNGTEAVSERNRAGRTAR
jgi:hypothetical protein